MQTSITIHKITCDNCGKEQTEETPPDRLYFYWGGAWFKMSVDPNVGTMMDLCITCYTAALHGMTNG